ncbi:chromosome segregation protein SMC [Lactobacillus psittaci]|uniref:Chromosome partition protein Smc n=1 Tax=Lactobacillus psittaci DSM 15354 TaxID=1122152 RepID=A0A0R1SBC1_9LACO|nr:chromosome segregation protein SMC [Lactobacillus psittaci]KRL63994.1 chromosome segregation protein SMC [Lactobacillus psittaci DSM 15354]
MPLTELTLTGFKSFAEKTKIEFGKGITGIVGPNGSGKSNITEAIRWVMGESSAKSLRGTNMKDVIFAGSQFRAPMNHAEVEMCFDNKDRSLQVDADRVTVARRILRSGDSEYLINNQTVRLKDVHALFMDSGISQDSLAIISQGKVDEILNSRPENRRLIFEEAAGVLRFKEQKQTAQHELEKTTDNLIRINDLVNELKGRVEPLHEQSSLAKEYKFQKRGLDEALKTLLAFEIEDLELKRADLTKKSAKSQNILSKLDNEVQRTQGELAQKKNQLNQANKEKEQLQEQLLQLTQKISNLNTNLQVAEQSDQYNDATKKEYQDQLSELKISLVKLTEHTKAIKKEQDQLSKEYDSLISTKKQLMQTLNVDPETLSKELEDLRNEYIEGLQAETTNNNDLVHLNNELKRLQNTSNPELDNVSKDLAKGEAELKELQEQGKAANSERKNLEAKVNALKERLADLTAKVKLQNTDLQTASQHVQAIKAKKEALANIQKRHEGYYYGVRNILNNLNDYPGVIGVVGELLQFPAELEAALTTALGGGVQDLVTKTKADARNAIMTLKQRRSGRATFLPLDGLRVNKIPASTVTTLKAMPGFIGVAADLVQTKTPEDITNAVDYLLGSVIIADTIDNAMKINSRVYRYRVVTLDGDVISPGGSMSGGAKNQKNNSPLQIASEISKLSKILEADQAKVDQIKAAIVDLQTELTTCQDNFTEQNNKLQAVSQDVTSLAISYQNKEQEVKRYRDAQKMYQARVDEKAKEILNLQAELATKKSKQTSLTDELAKKKEEISEKKRQIADFDNLNKEVQAKLSDLNPQLAVLKTKKANLESKLAEADSQIKLNQTQTKNLETKLANLSSSAELSESQRKEAKAEVEKLTSQKEQVQEQMKALSAKLGQLDAQISQLDATFTRNYDLRKDAASEQEQYSIELAQVKTKMKQNLDKLRDEYQLSYELALKQSKLENTAENQAKLKKQVKLHQMSLDDIGPVNLSAIAEYDEVKQRYDFLTKQQDDLLKAKEDIEKSMTSLDEEVKRRFKSSFEKIAKSFSQIFPVVFGGGNAKLVLTDSDNLLETGIEIIAQPPGKKLQRLSLLSGGERALTAITLLFAILQVNPVPFCILDEVEAALDDANVTRFAKFLHHYDMHTQFIVITHRRGTMEKADQLYGVVMQESGVSQVLSVSLKEIKDEVS